MKVFSIFVATLMVFVSPVEAETVVRAAIDIGSGATKLRVAEVDLDEGRVKKILVDQAFTVAYQEHLEQSKEGEFDREIMRIGMNALEKSAQIARRYRAERVVAVATAAFRKATNAESFIQRVHEKTGVKIYVIDQELEGILNFQAVMGEVDLPPEQVVVWDIGGGSLQLTAQDKNGRQKIYRGHMASVPFKNHIIKKIQKRDPLQIKTPNPMTKREISRATRVAQKIGKGVDKEMIRKIRRKGVRVVGVGSIFNYRILPLVENKSLFSKKFLQKKVKGLAGLTDADVGGGDFANVAISNPILILGIMRGARIDKVQIIDVNSADGAFLYPKFWK